MARPGGELSSSLPAVLAAPTRPVNNLLNFAKDCFAGTLGGIAAVCLGHPFDTLKVRLQTQPVVNPVYAGMGDCFRQTMAQEGVPGFYRGVSSPLVSQMFLRALHFSAYSQARGWVERRAHSRGEAAPRRAEYFLAGGVTGAVVACAEGPSDFYKSQLQVQQVRALADPRYKPPFRSLAGAVRASFEALGPKAPLRGFGVTMLRNVPANATYFGSFESMRWLVVEARQRGEQPGELPLPLTMALAGTAGCLYWIAIYPLDVLKSSIQSDSLAHAQRRYGPGLARAARTLWAEGGLRRCYRGFAPCLMRALPANAVMLTTVDRVQAYLKK